MFSSVLKDADDQEKVSYILLWSGEKGLDIYNSWTFTKEEDRKKTWRYFRTVRESVGTEDKSSSSQIYTARNATRRRRASG